MRSRNSTCCCKFLICGRFVERIAPPCFAQRPLTFSGWEGARNGTSQKTCLVAPPDLPPQEYGDESKHDLFRAAVAAFRGRSGRRVSGGDAAARPSGRSFVLHSFHRHRIPRAGIRCFRFGSVAVLRRPMDGRSATRKKIPGDGMNDFRRPADDAGPTDPPASSRMTRRQATDPSCGGIDSLRRAACTVAAPRFLVFV